MPLKKGFTLLKEERYQEASEYFIWESQMAFSQRPFNAKHYYNCLYGQARALIGLQDYELAAEILRDLIRNEPHWETPYITLARLWEDLGYLNVAEYLYGGAILSLGSSDRLRQHYVWFLKENLAEDGVSYKTAQTFTPAFNRKVQSLAEIEPDRTLSAVAEKLEQLGLEEANRFCP